ncbi:hypothetical protein Taro_031504 [Colocasia esculenta]|uniref:Uncharacterized protein n=1 Tax=Colocasia esculenta TaxID=4460 RepID=A0A843VUU9_COLES|nr:hypothetical protein [Colocasia esculenta]
MNVPIIDPLQGDFPEVIEEYLQHGNMKCIAFNRRGTLLAEIAKSGLAIGRPTQMKEGPAKPYKLWRPAAHTLLQVKTVP